MQRGERIEIIKRIAKGLAISGDWQEIDFVLDQFGFPTEGRWAGTMDNYVRYMVKDGKDSELLEIDRYLMGQTRPDDEPWEADKFKLFISHIVKHKAEAHELKYALRLYGLDGFVAHEDIKGGKEWQKVIEAALHSCDAFTALLRVGFKESDWCDQEVGIALGNGTPVVPIRFDLNPYGFFGSLQAIAGTVKDPKTLARELVEILLEDKRCAESLTEAIVRQLTSAESFFQANTLARVLVDSAQDVSREQVQRLRKAQKSNGQVEGAYDVDGYLRSLERKLPAQGPAYDDDEPF